MTITSRRRRGCPFALMAVITILVVALGGGAAFAYYKTNGSGSGSAKVGTDVTATVAAATAANDLFPGHAGTVSFTLHNPNPYTANFSSISGATVTSANPTDCPASNVTVVTLPFAISPTISVAPGATTGTKTLAGLISMSGSAPNLCQGVSFSVTLTLSGQSS